MRIRNIISVIACLAIMASCNEASDSGQNADSVSPSETAAVPDMHHAQNSLDVNGAYVGTLPCADCEGIKTTITLNNDSSYTKTEEYLGKKGATFNDQGTWSFLPDGNTIVLNNGKDTPIKFKAGENKLTRLDTEGHEITGALAEYYVLEKQPDR